MLNSALFTLTIGSHFFKINRISSKVKSFIFDFARRYIKYGIQPGQNTFHNKDKQSELTPIAIFCAATKDRNEFRFHINQLEEFKIWLKLNHITDNVIEIIDKPTFTGLEVDFVLKPQWELREYQKPVVDYIVNNDGNKSKFVGIQTGFGKAQSLDSLIKVPGCWSTMGEMQVGTEIIAKDGSTTKVTGVFPQGKKQLYRVTFSDGRSVECCAEHLWRVYYVNRNWQVIDTNEMLKLLSMHNHRLYIDLINPEQDEDIELTLETYTLGVVLANKNIFKDYSGFNSVLTELGLIEKLNHEKFIPKIYLHASYNQRVSIIQGLLDTDGCYNTNNTIEYSVPSEQLALDFQYLIRSVGGIASITKAIPFYKNQTQINYNINATVKKSTDLFRLQAKKQQIKNNNNYYRTLKLRVTNVEKTRIADAQCISIDHPDRLYITNDFIVTHNTLTALYACSKIKKKIAIIVKPMYIYKWVEDVQKYYDISVERIMVVQGLQNLQALLELANTNQLNNIDVFIISNKTMQLYIKQYENYSQDLIDQGYICTPENLFETLGAGIRLIDEVHQDFHLNFKIDMYTHIPLTLSLSATLLNKDPFMERVYEIAYPKHTRYAEQALEKYINSYAVLYRTQPGLELRANERGSKNYSHNAFEESIIKHKNKSVYQNYLKLIKHTVDCSFYYDYKKGERLIIFCYRTDFCQMVVEYLRKQYPQLDIRKYTAEDPDENMYEADIRVTTLGSGSTAHDISNLKTAILTVAVDSVQSNIQALGRLRKLKDMSPRFYYFVCTDIPKHVQYHYSKEMLMRQRALTFKTIYAPFSI